MRIPETADYGVHTARVAKIALKTRRTIREVALSEGVMTEAQLAEVFATDNLLRANSPTLKWYSWVGSNHRPPDPQSGALTN